MSDLLNLAPTQEMGYGATSGVPFGWLPEEVPDLQWPKSVAVYDRMRRTDPQVAAVWRAIDLVASRLVFRVDPGVSEDEVVSLTADDLGLSVIGSEADLPPPKRTRDRFRFGEHWRLARLAAVHGVSVFEQVGRVVEDDRTPSGLAWRLRKLAFRHPGTIAEFVTCPDGGLDKVIQHPPPLHQRGDRKALERVEIPVDRLVVYAQDREAGAWTGNSLLRSAYKPWLLKDRTLRVLLQTAERNGLGVPIMEAPPGATKEQVEGHYNKFAQQFRSGDAAGGAVPNGARLRLVGVEGTLPDLIAQLSYHDEQIAENFLAQFLRLGVTRTGARALGESFTEFFTMAVYGLAIEFADTLTAYHVEDTVDWNFGPDYAAPRVVAVPPTEEQVLQPQELATLVDAGLLPPGDSQLRGYVRDRFGLPQETQQDQGVATRRGVTVRASRPRGAWRVMTALEEQAGFEPESTHDGHEAQLAALLALWGGVREQWRGSVTEQIRTSSGLAELDQLDVPRGEGAAMIEAHMVEAASRGMDDATTEAATQGRSMGGVTPPDPDEFTDASYGLEALLAGIYLSSARGRAATAAGSGPWDAPSVASAVGDHLAGLKGQADRDWLGGAVTGAYTLGRLDAYASGPPARYVASELLDNNTCTPCSAVDGTVYNSLAEARADYPAGIYHACQGGPRCRGTVLAIYD